MFKLYTPICFYLFLFVFYLSSGPGWYASFESDDEEDCENSISGKTKSSSSSSYRRYPLHGRAKGASVSTPAISAASTTTTTALAACVNTDSTVTVTTANISSTATSTQSPPPLPPPPIDYMRIAGRRLLPVCVKDVAGLVPGAYKGRGKGNRFLADLCDADVLVHVVDVTGQADRDGNAVSAVVSSAEAGAGAGVCGSTATISSGTAAGDSVTPECAQDKGSSPMEDAEWIREELHRWIYGNVRGKWSSVLARTRVPKSQRNNSNYNASNSAKLVTQQQRDRCAERVLALFTGYQGPRWCVEAAALRAGLQLERGSEWSAVDLHRMVAHFLSIRFPICLALNKIDALSSAVDGGGVNNNNVDDVIRHCQAAAFARGEVAVPVSARAECWQLNRLAAATVAASTTAIPAPLSAKELEEEAVHRRVMLQYGTTGVLEVRL